MKKRLLSVVLALVLALSLALPVLATSYSDLEGHWAEPYMEDLSSRGYLTGYEDGTMRPDNNVTACEALVLLSRLYKIDDNTRNTIMAAYQDYLEDAFPAALSWAFDELAICLAADIVTPEELEALALGAPLEKEKLCIFAVRALQMTELAATMQDRPLTFDDAQDISVNAWGSVALLVSMGIINGDDKNCFCPQSSVTRAVTATILSRMLSYMDDNHISLTLEKFEGVTQAEGVLLSVNGSTAWVRGIDGLTRTYLISSNADVTVGGVTQPLTNQYKDHYIVLTLKDDEVKAASVRTDPGVTWVQGRLSTRYSAAGTNYVYVTDLDTGTEIKCYTDNNTVFTQDGRVGSIQTLMVGSFATVCMSKDLASSVVADSAIYDRSGTITTLNYGTTVDFRITDNAGTVWEFPLTMSSLPTITRNGADISIDRLNIGDQVTVEEKGGSVLSIKAEASETTFTGQLVAITTTSTGTSWTIKCTDDITRTFTLDKGATVHKGQSTIRLSDINVDDTVTVTVYGSTITDINRETGVTTTTKITGTVLAIDSKTKVVTLLYGENLLYVDTYYAVTIVEASTGKIITANDIKLDSTLTAHGTYKDSSNFRGTTIVVE